jgi:hypothetical protein
MKKTLLAAIIPALAISRAYMSDPTDTAAAAPAPADSAAPTVTKESLLARVESLLEAGYAEVDTLIHDALAGIEDFFGHTAAAPTTDSAPATTEPAEARNDTPATDTAGSTTTATAA